MYRSDLPMDPSPGPVLHNGLHILVHGVEKENAKKKLELFLRTDIRTEVQTRLG